MKLIPYLRVSDPKQAKKGSGGARDTYGLDVQQADIERWAALDKHELVGMGEYADKQSGATDSDARPGLYGAIKRACAERADGLVAARRDRFGRGGAWIGAMEYVLKKEWKASKNPGPVPRLLCADGMGNDPEDTLASVIMKAAQDMLAAVERILIRDRLHGGKRYQAHKHGHHHGGKVPYGYRRGPEPGTLVVQPMEAMMVIRVFEMEGQPLSVIAREMAKRGHMARNGEPLGHSQVRKILARREFYEGRRLLVGTVVPDAGVACAHPNIWEAVKDDDDGTADP
jgi:DNA invertase Pin-like site-specific DNA recombinase